MRVVDASALYEVLVRGPLADRISEALDLDPEAAAPHMIDVEIFGIIRREVMRSRIDRTKAGLAIENLKLWRGERFSHVTLLDRAWELRDTVRGWDAMYVALAEALEVPLLTTDVRLANAAGPRCEFQVFSAD